MATAKVLERTAQDWFQEAERTYTEKHQGCPWCGGSHRVFCQRRDDTVIFYCQGCDFQSSHDTGNDHFEMNPGFDESNNPIPETMYALRKTLS